MNTHSTRIEPHLFEHSTKVEVEKQESFKKTLKDTNAYAALNPN
jgi:hypothetical protein